MNAIIRKKNTSDKLYPGVHQVRFPDAVQTRGRTYFPDLFREKFLRDAVKTLKLEMRVILN